MKKKILGIPLTFLVIGLLMIVGATAALVGYLSNTVQLNVAIDSPIDVKISSDGLDYNHEPYEITDDTYASGGAIIFYVKVENLANVPVTGIVENIVESLLSVSDGSMSCGDFESVIATTTSTYEDASDVPTRVVSHCVPLNGNDTTDPTKFTCGDWELIEYCTQLDRIYAIYDRVQFNYGPNADTDNSVTFAPGQIDETKIEVTFKPNAKGTYEFTSRVVPAVT